MQEQWLQNGSGQRILHRRSPEQPQHLRRGCGAIAHSGDQDVGDAAILQTVQDVNNFSCRARTGKAHDAVVVAIPGEFGGGEGIRETLALALAGNGVCLRDKPRCSTPDDGNGLTIFGKCISGNVKNSTPQLRLAVNFFRSKGHRCLHCYRECITTSVCLYYRTKKEIT